MPCCWPNLLFIFLSPVIFYFSSLNGLVVCDCGLRIDSVLTFSQPYTADSFLIIIIIIWGGGSYISEYKVLCGNM